MTLLKGRLVANMLGMEARQLGDPFTLVILVESDDDASHRCWAM